MVNRPQELSLADILEQLRPDETPPDSTLQVPIYQGGPVQTDRGFVLHSSECSFQASVALEGLTLSTSQDILLAIAAGVGPKQSLITLGYAGWKPASWKRSWPKMPGSTARSTRKSSLKWPVTCAWRPPPAWASTCTC